MRYVSVDLPSELAYIDLYAVSDVHRGHRCFDERAWSTLLTNIATDPHAYLVLNGDLIEAALKSSRYGDTYRTMPPGEERRTVQRELEMVKHKVLCVTAGNHDMRPAKDSDECPAEIIADNLDLSERYDPIAVVLAVSFGKHQSHSDKPTRFVFYVTHGAGGGRRPGGKLNRMQELAWVIEGVDGYILGHVHDLAARVETRYFADPRNSGVGKRAVAYVIAGSFLNYGDYAQVAMYAPNATSMPILRLFERKHSDKHKQMQIILPTRIMPR